jgi:hypothetical protein
LALPWPEPELHSLPPILRMPCQASIPGYSKGSWGLSVLLRDCGIFTTSTISPSPSLRHCSSRYAVHARRNLPDKELRYLRTVPSPGNLRLTANRILTCFIVTHAGIITCYRSTTRYRMASTLIATLSYRLQAAAAACKPAASVFYLFPVIIGAELLDQ